MENDKIAVVEDEAERVRLIYRRYLELGGVNALVRDLRKRDIRTKSRLLATGVTRGGVPFGRGSLFYLLRNRFYIGEVKYKDETLLSLRNRLHQPDRDGAKSSLTLSIFSGEDQPKPFSRR